MKSEKREYLSVENYGCKSVVIIREDNTTLVLSHIETGFCLWDLCFAVSYNGIEELVSVLLDNENYGCSVGMYDSYREMCEDLSLPYNADDERYLES